MSKFLGWLGGSLIAFGIAYTLLPLGYEMIISWFGPVLGYPLRPIIAAFYNLFGDYSDVFRFQGLDNCLSTTQLSVSSAFLRGQDLFLQNVMFYGCL